MTLSSTKVIWPIFINIGYFTSFFIPSHTYLPPGTSLPPGFSFCARAKAGFYTEIMRNCLKIQSMVGEHIKLLSLKRHLTKSVLKTTLVVEVEGGTVVFNGAIMGRMSLASVVRVLSMVRVLLAA